MSISVGRSIMLGLLIAACAITAAAIIMAVNAPKAKADHGGVSVHPGAPLGFGVVCNPVHEFDNVDPITGSSSSHIHAFTGGAKDKDITANTTPTTLRSSTTSCQHSADKALYWTPKASSGVQTQVNYYQPEGPNSDASLGTFPAGLRIIAGSIPENGNSTRSSHVTFGCQGDVATSATPINCGTNRVKVEIEFPNCVERDSSGALKEDSADHRSHMHYTDGSGNCQGDAREVPELEQHWIYNATNGNNITWSVPNYDMHADFMNGWNQTSLASIIDTCITGNGPDGGCMRITN